MGIQNNRGVDPTSISQVQTRETGKGTKLTERLSKDVTGDTNVKKSSIKTIISNLIGKIFGNNSGSGKTSFTAEKTAIYNELDKGMNAGEVSRKRFNDVQKIIDKKEEAISDLIMEGAPGYAEKQAILRQEIIDLKSMQ